MVASFAELIEQTPNQISPAVAAPIVAEQTVFAPAERIPVAGGLTVIAQYCAEQTVLAWVGMIPVERVPAVAESVEAGVAAIAPTERIPSVGKSVVSLLAGVVPAVVVLAVVVSGKNGRVRKSPDVSESGAFDGMAPVRIPLTMQKRKMGGTLAHEVPDMEDSQGCHSDHHSLPSERAWLVQMQMQNL